MVSLLNKLVPEAPLGLDNAQGFQFIDLTNQSGAILGPADWTPWVFDS